MYRILSSERIELPRFAVLDRSGPEPPQEIKLFKISYTECSLIDARSYMYLINSYFDNLFSYSNSNREILIFTLVYYATVTNLDMSWCQLAFFFFIWSKSVLSQFEEDDDHVIVNGVVFNKPFVEKPIDAEDHNIIIYYPASAGGGSQRLFRKGK